MRHVPSDTSAFVIKFMTFLQVLLKLWIIGI